MALSQRSIKIVQQANESVAFQPDLPGAQPGQPLGALGGDLITWNNTTNNAHQPEGTNPTSYLTEQIPAGQVSDPIYKAPAGPTTITYACKLHPQEQGSIVVS